MNESCDATSNSQTNYAQDNSLDMDILKEEPCIENNGEENLVALQNRNSRSRQSSVNNSKGDTEQILRSPSSERHGVSQRSRSSSTDSGSINEIHNVKRRKKRKRPSDPMEKAIRQKAAQIERSLRWSNSHRSVSSSEKDVEENKNDVCLGGKTTKEITLRELAISEHGLINDDLRRRAWPQLVGVDMLTETSILPTQEEVEGHKSYKQVVLDVDRSLKRFPPGISDEQRPGLQDQLVRLIVRVLTKHPDLHYYQGYHDIAITFLLVVGEESGFHIVERLSAGKQLREFMEPTMERTTYLLHFMYPVLNQESPELHAYLEKSEVGTIFALPWLITWFSHVLPDYKDVVRLFDFFLAQPHYPMMPVYLATAIVLHRRNEILMSGSENCDMAYVHALLSRIPISDTLPFEKLLASASYLHSKYPPHSIEKEVKARIKRVRFAFL